MTTYPPYREYVPHPDFQSWLEARGLSQTYVDVFDWDRRDVLEEYDRLFRLHQTTDAELTAVNARFDRLFAERIAYMDAHNIQHWKDLDSDKDAEHLERKGEMFAAIAETSHRRKELQHTRDEVTRAIPLFAGILNDFYPNFEAICAEERATHFMNPPMIQLDGFWDKVGPLNDPNWGVLPKISGTSV